MLLALFAAAALAQTVGIDVGTQADAAAGVIYMAVPGDRIEAVRISDGSAVWSTDAAALAVAANAEQVGAIGKAGEAMELVVLSAADGAVVKRCAPQPMPASFPVAVEQGLGYQFAARGRFDDQGRLVVTWEAIRSHVSGVLIDDPPPTRYARGEVTCDPASGEATARADAVTTEPPPPPSKKALKLADQWRATVRVAADGWIAGWKHEGGGIRVDRYDPVAKKDIGPLQLDGTLGPYFSPDLRQVAVGQAVDTGVRRRVYDLRSGAELGELAREGKDGHLAFVLLAGDVIVTRPAVDLVAYGLGGDGSVLWTHAMRDRAYRGEYPP
jgi:hypothetical protein